MAPVPHLSRGSRAALRAAGAALLAGAFDLVARAAAAARALREAFYAAFVLRWGDPFAWGGGTFPALTRGFRACAVEGLGGDPRGRAVAAFAYRLVGAPGAGDWRWARELAGCPPLVHTLHFWGDEGAASLLVDPSAGSVRLLRGVDSPGVKPYPAARAGPVYSPCLLYWAACQAAGFPAGRRREPARAPSLRSDIPSEEAPPVQAPAPWPPVPCGDAILPALARAPCCEAAPSALAQAPGTPEPTLGRVGASPPPDAPSPGARPSAPEVHAVEPPQEARAVEQQHALEVQAMEEQLALAAPAVEEQRALEVQAMEEQLFRRQAQDPRASGAEGAGPPQEKDEAAGPPQDEAAEPPQDEGAGDSDGSVCEAGGLSLAGGLRRRG